MTGWPAWLPATSCRHLSAGPGVAATLHPHGTLSRQPSAARARYPVLCCTCEARGTVAGAGGARTGSHVHLHIGKFLKNCRALRKCRQILNQIWRNPVVKANVCFSPALAHRNTPLTALHLVPLALRPRCNCGTADCARGVAQLHTPLLICVG